MQEERRRAAAEARSKKLRTQLENKRKVRSMPSQSPPPRPHQPAGRTRASCGDVAAALLAAWARPGQACLAPHTSPTLPHLTSPHQTPYLAPPHPTHPSPQDLDKFEKLAALPSIQEALADKYSR